MLHVHQLVQSLGQDYLLVETDVHLQAHGVVDHLKSALGLVDGALESRHLHQYLIRVHLLGNTGVHRFLGKFVQFAHCAEVAPKQFHRLRTDQCGKIQQTHLLGHLLL